MTPIEVLDIIEIIWTWVWRVSWQASLLVILICGVQWLFRKRMTPEWRHALWLLVLVRLLLPGSFESGYSLFNYTAVDWSPRAALEETAPSEVAWNFAPLKSAGWEHGEPWRPPMGSDVGSGFSQSSGVAPMIVSAEAASGKWHWTGLRFLSIAWLAGAFVLGARMGIGVLLFRRCLARGRPVESGDLLEVLEECRKVMGLRRAPKLIETAGVDSPGLFGFFQARLLIPKRWKGRFSREEWRHIFLHECAHIRRLDLPLNGLAAAAQVLHWFNPLVWWGLHRMRVERELACDALALAHGREADPRSYGATMIKLLEQFNRPAALPGLVGILEETSQIKQRIHMITQFRKPSRWSALAAAPLLLLALVCLTDARTGPRGTEVIPLLDNSSDAEAGEPSDRRAGKSAASADSEPSPGGHLKDRSNPAALLEDARLLLEVGKLKEAAEVLNKIVEADSDHKPALYYLKMIKERQASLSARPRPSSQDVSTRRAARARILHKLDQIVVAQIAYEDAPLKEVVRDLNEKARQGDPEGRGIHFIINPHFDKPREGHQLPMDAQPLAPTAEDKDLHMVPIRLNLTKVRLLDVLDAIIQVAEERITYSIADDAVVFAR